MAESIPISLLQTEENVPLPAFLPGEIVVTRAENVLRYGAMSESKSGTAGVLYVTNFRVTFLTTSSSSERLLSSVFQSNPDLTEGDIYAGIQQELHIPLTCILEVHCTTKVFTGLKAKKMLPGAHVSSKVQVVEILCKDLRLLRFGLKFVSKSARTTIVNSILHYAYPSALSLMFAFSYSQALLKEQNVDNETLSAVPSFRSLPDWLNELSRLRVDDTWRVVDVNTNFRTCPSLSALFVCPASLSDSDINRMSLHYIDARIPIWCWSHPVTRVPVLYSGAAGRPEGIFLEKEETLLFKLISSMAVETDHKGGGVKVINVSKRCASTRELQHSFLKLKNLCILDTTKSFWSIDPHWLSSLDNTRWLAYVHSSLTAAMDVAQTVCDDGRPVIIKETSGRDLVLVVASLAQLILDSYYRTIRGFQSLLQRMWVLGGHPFNLRYGHVKPRTKENEKDEKESEESPVFLHFLDCVFQLMNQFPSSFEFSETYLLGLFDALLSCMFDTFLFDSERQRHDICQTELQNESMTSLWDFMTDYLSDSKTASVFTNPLYEFVTSVTTEEIAVNGTNLQQHSYLKMSISAASMKFWSGFFLRWLPVVHVSAGLGENSSSHLQQMILMNEVKVLRYRLSVLKSDNDPKYTINNSKAKDLGNHSVDGDFDSTVNFELGASRLLTPSMPFIGDLSLNTYMISAEIPTGDFADSSSQLDDSGQSN